jgi:signal peptidase II
MDNIKNFLDQKMKFQAKIIILVSLILLLTTTDLIVKQIVAKNIKYGKAITVVDGFWYIGYTENDDMGLSLLRNITRDFDTFSKYILMVSMQGIACIIALIIYFRIKQLKYLIPLALIICGGLGNLIDRIIRGYVVDYVMWFFKFIPVDFFNPFPVFNLADVYASTGAVLLLILLLFFADEEKQQKSLQPEE